MRTSQDNLTTLGDCPITDVHFGIEKDHLRLIAYIDNLFDSDSSFETTSVLPDPGQFGVWLAYRY